MKAQPSAVVIPGAGLNMDSITASPHMVKMASNLLLGGNQAASQGEKRKDSFETNLNCPGTPTMAPANGSLPSSPSKLPGSPAAGNSSPLRPVPPGASAPASSPLAGLGAGKQSFYYKDPALPMGWYIKVDRTQVGGIRTNIRLSNSG